MKTDNLTLLTDLYQMTMIQGYYQKGMRNKTVVFDMFFRRNPCGGGFAVAAGLAQVIEYIKNIRFGESDIAYLRGLGCFTPDFLDRLRDFHFTGDIHAVPEGTVVFPQEPLLRVTAPIMEGQFIETAVLNIINHQSLIATKAARVAYAAQGDAVLEFGLRRAQGPDAGVYGARAAIIGGCAATSNVLCGQMFGAPVRGTHAHSWIMSFPDELTAFRAYADVFPDACTLLVDTYDTLKSGVPNAIRVFEEMSAEMRARGQELTNYGIRLDSGDFAYLSKKARKMLDAAGFETASISASSDLDEYMIRDLKLQGAEITIWGVGTNLITSQDCPSFGGVYKLAAETENGGPLKPAIKLSEEPEKVTNPAVKKIVRLYGRRSGRIKADLITLDSETVNTEKDLTIFDPLATWKRMTLPGGGFMARELLVPVFLGGECVYESPGVLEIRDYCLREQATLWDEYRRLVKPQVMPVDLSQPLWDLKQRMIREIRGQ